MSERPHPFAPRAEPPVLGYWETQIETLQIGPFRKVRVTYRPTGLYTEEESDQLGMRVLISRCRESLRDKLRLGKELARERRRLPSPPSTPSAASGSPPAPSSAIVAGDSTASTRTARGEESEGEPQKKGQKG